MENPPKNREKIIVKTQCQMSFTLQFNGLHFIVTSLTLRNSKENAERNELELCKTCLCKNGKCEYQFPHKAENVGYL